MSVSVSVRAHRIFFSTKWYQSQSVSGENGDCQQDGVFSISPTYQTKF